MSFDQVPFRVVLSITQEFYQLRIGFDEYTHPNLGRLFFGYFKKDRTKKLFCIFCTLYIEQSQMMKFYDPPILKKLPISYLKGVEFNYVYYSYCSYQFLEKATNLQSLERVMIHEDTSELIPKIANLKKLVVAVHEVTDDNIRDFNKLKKLTYLGYKLINGETPKIETVKSGDIEILTLNSLYINTYVPKSYTFSKLPNLSLLHIWYSKITNTQLLYLSKHPNLRELQFQRCHLGNRAINLFQSHTIRELCISFCNLTISEDTIKDFVIDEKRSKLEAIEFSGIVEFADAFWTEFVKLKSLRKMFLSRTDLDDSFLMNIVERKESMCWENGFYLQISTTKQISEKAEEMFLQEFPFVELKIFRSRK